MKKIIDINKSLFQKIEDKNKYKKNIDNPFYPIDQERTDLRKVFKKYLEVQDYGIKKVE